MCWLSGLLFLVTIFVHVGYFVSGSLVWEALDRMQWWKTFKVQSSRNVFGQNTFHLISPSL